MALTDYRPDAMRCTRCSYCKWIPFDLVKSHRFAKGCPSIAAHSFHAYSAGGRLVTALSLMDGRSEVSEQVVDIAFRCQLCGSCDVACKMCRYDMEPLAALRELRAHLVEMDRVPDSYRPLIERTRAALAGTGPKTPAERNAWAAGLGLKDPTTEPVDVVFYAGCKYSGEESLRETARTQARLLQLAGLSVGLFENASCGGLAAALHLDEREAGDRGEQVAGRIVDPLRAVVPGTRRVVDHGLTVDLLLDALPGHEGLALAAEVAGVVVGDAEGDGRGEDELAVLDEAIGELDGVQDLGELRAGDA